MSKKVDPVEVREALAAVADWLLDDGPAPVRPGRAAVARAVRLSARMLAQEAPGHSVELRVPPFVAVQCVDGPRHTRGTPPNVVETSAQVWLEIVTGKTTFSAALAAGVVDASGTRADISDFVPLYTSAELEGRR